MNLDLIIPTYNRAHLLDECLRSVVRAKRPVGVHINVVVVDNNSSDNTRGMVQPYLQHSELTIQYIFVARAGKSAALNEAFARTSGEIVGMIDDDEQLEENWFSVVHREFSQDATLEFIGGQYLPNWEIPLPADLPPVEVYGSGLGIILRPRRVEFTPQFDGILMGGNCAIRRTTLKSVLPYPEHIGKIGRKIRSGEDEILYHRLLKIGGRGMSVPDLIIYHWIPAERLTRTYYRRWAFGRAVGEGCQIKEKGFEEPSLLGIQRYKFGDAAKGLLSIFRADSSCARLLGELKILDFLGVFHGHHFYRRFHILKQKWLNRSFPVAGKNGF